MRSAMRTVLKRWEMSTAVLPWVSSLKRSKTSYSARASRAALGNHGIGEALVGGLLNAGLVLALRNASHGQVLAGGQLEAHEILENHADFLAQLGGVVLAQVVAIEQDAALAGVVEAGQQLDERGFARAVFAHQRQLFARVQLEAEVAQGPLFGVFVLKAHVLKREALPDGARKRPHRLPQRGPHDARRNLEKLEEILQVQRPVGHLAKAAQNAFKQGAQLPERAGQKRELTDANTAMHRPHDNVQISPIVARRTDTREHGTPAGAAQRQGFVLAVKLVGERLEAVYQKIG
nr:hypothetical protein [Tanacetum cinerariifolium]